MFGGVSYNSIFYYYCCYSQDVPDIRHGTHLEHTKLLPFQRTWNLLKARHLPLLGTYNVDCLGAKMTCCVPQMNRLQRRGVLILTATILIRVMVCSLQFTDFAVCTHWIPQGYERRTAGSRSTVNETCFDSHLSLCLVWKVGREARWFHDVRECKLIDSCQVTSFEDVYCILCGRIGHSGGVVPRQQ